MLVLTVRTDNPQAEVGLYDDHLLLAHESWQAHRLLAETLHQKIRSLLKSAKKDWQDIEGIVAYEGPGSFTGLRIGLSVANALAYSNNINVVAAGGDNWCSEGISLLKDGKGQDLALPKYGGEVHITPPRS